MEDGGGVVYVVVVIKNTDVVENRKIKGKVRIKLSLGASAIKVFFFIKFTHVQFTKIYSLLPVSE